MAFGKYHFTLNIRFHMYDQGHVPRSWWTEHIPVETASPPDEMNQDLCSHLYNTLAATCRPTQLCKIHWNKQAKVARSREQIEEPGNRSQHKCKEKLRGVRPKPNQTKHSVSGRKDVKASGLTTGQWTAIVWPKCIELTVLVCVTR